MSTKLVIWELTFFKVILEKGFYSPQTCDWESGIIGKQSVEYLKGFLFVFSLSALKVHIQLGSEYQTVLFEWLKVVSY